jgi:hypothetical protein
MSFINGALLPALLLASVPIIIHLFFRRQFQRIDWAPMRYLQLTIRRNRRRLQIEQLILLLLRILAVAAIVMAVCRPVLSDSGLVGWLTSRGRTARIIIVDDSLSMGYTVDTGSAFSAAGALISKSVDRIKSEDTLTLLLTSTPEQPLVDGAHVDDPDAIVDMVESIELSDALSNWTRVFTAVDTILERIPQPVREITIVTDLRAAGWSDDLNQMTGRWADEDVQLRIIDLGSQRTDNVALLDLSETDAIALPGAAVNIVARIRNDNESTIENLQATLTIGEQARPVIIPELPPGIVTEVDLTATFDTAGDHLVSLSLPQDALAQDNRRERLIIVRDQLDILLIDGEPDNEAFAGETDFLSLALAVGDVPWQVRQAIDTDWLNSAPTTPDLLVLANVASITERRAEILARQVNDGMGLIIFSGSLIDPQIYNELLYRNGQGLLPARFERVSDDAATGMAVVPHEDSPLDQLGKIAASALGSITASRYTTFSLVDDREGVRTLATWNDTLRSPVAIERRFGKGRVLLWSITADRSWSDWPVDPTYVLAMREAAMGTARPTADERNAEAGAELTLKVADSANMQEPRIVTPGSTDTRPLTTDANGFRFGDSRFAGVYTMQWQDATGKQQKTRLAVSPSADESHLARIPDDQLRGYLGNLEPVIVHAGSNSAELSDGTNEIWRNLALLVLAFLFCESLMTLWIGRYR